MSRGCELSDYTIAAAMFRGVQVGVGFADDELKKMLLATGLRVTLKDLPSTSKRWLSTSARMRPPTVAAP